MKQSIKVLVPCMVEVEFVSSDDYEPVIGKVLPPSNEAIMQQVYVKPVERIDAFAQGGVEFGQWALIHCGMFKLQKVG